MFQWYCGDSNNPHYHQTTCIARRLITDPETHNDKEARKRYKELSKSQSYEDGMKEMLEGWCKRYADARGDNGIRKQLPMKDLHKLPQSRVCDLHRNYQFNVDLAKHEKKTGKNFRDRGLKRGFRNNIPNVRAAFEPGYEQEPDFVLLDDAGNWIRD